MFVGNSGDSSWMNSQQSVAGGYQEVDLSSLNVMPEYHTGRPTYTCPHCAKQFLYSSQLRQHVRFHLKHRPFHCPVCSKTFVQSSNLIEHFRIHTDERPFACGFCERRFRQSSNLNYHIRTAHGSSNASSPDKQSATTAGHLTDKSPSATKRSESKTFSCEHCGRCYAHACQLMNHARVHSRDKPFECQFCHKVFSYSSNLAEHVRIHTGERPYVCGTCNRSFAQSSQLKVHAKAHHPDVDDGNTLLVVCPVCNLHINGLRALRNHLKQHSSPSTKVFAKPGDLKQSVTKFRPNRQKSLQSLKSLSRSRKSVARRGALPVKWTYVCCHCERAFVKQSQLMTHLWSHEGMSLEPAWSLPSGSHGTNVNVKTEDGNDSSAADVEEPAKIRRTRSQLDSNLKGRSIRHDRRLSCPYCSKQFAHRRKWKIHVKVHKAGRPRCINKQSLGQGLSSKKTLAHDSSLKTKPHGQRSVAEQLEEIRAFYMAGAKMENGNSGSCDHIETSQDVSLDGDDNTDELDPAPTGHRQERKGGSVSDGAENVLADAVATGIRRRRPRQRKSKATTTKSRTYPCDQCDRIMASAAALHYHRRTHTGYKPFACSQCPRRFIIRGQLVEHERIHSGEKPFACEHCAKRFAQSSQLRQHVSVHSEVGTHVCPTCGEAFTRPWRLQSHRRAAHADDTGSRKRYRCEECGREYSLRQSWIYHRLTHSSDRPFQCDVCSKQFRVAGQLRQHANHCCVRKAQNQTTVDPYDQPSQNWVWFSQPDSELLAPTVGQSTVVDVPANASTLDDTDSDEHRPEHTGHSSTSSDFITL